MLTARERGLVPALRSIVTCMPRHAVFVRPEQTTSMGLCADPTGQVALHGTHASLLRTGTPSKPPCYGQVWLDWRGPGSRR